MHFEYTLSDLYVEERTLITQIVNAEKRDEDAEDQRLELEAIRAMIASRES